nr:EF-hand domain pair [Tanacetum cinerariifolium]GEW36755.1 EF-hand domain pair [Tanacetum cinerariifolium]
MHSRDERRTTQNSGICSSGEDGEMYYGQLEEILEFSYMSLKIVLFRVKWFDNSNKGRVKHLVIRNNITQILANEDDPDIIHVDNSSDLALSTSLSDLEITALHIDGQSINVDAPPDIIDDDDDDDEDDDIIDDDDVLPHDLADFDDEDLVNVDDDDSMSADLARGHDGDGGDDDHPPPHQLADGCRDNGTMMPLDDHSSHWANLLREIVREFSMHFGSWHNILAERKAGVLKKIGMQSSTTQEYLFLIRTFFDTHTIGGVFLWDEDRRIYEEMQRLHALGEYIYDQIMVMVRKGKQRGYIPSFGQGLARRGKDVLDVLVPRCNHTFDFNELKRNNKQIDMIKKIMSSDDKMSYLLTQLQSQHETSSGSGSGSESGAGGDNKSGDDKDTDKDEEDVNS